MSGLFICCLLLPGQPLVDSIFNHQAEVAARLKGVSYRADLTYIETDLLRQRADTITCRRRVIMDRYENQQDVITSVAVNHQSVQGRQRNRVLSSLRQKGMFARQTRLPFLVENREFYLYADAGPVAVGGETLRAVRFTPKRPDRRHITGTGYFLPGTWELVRLEFIPAELPRIVDSTRMILKYQPLDRFWLPVEFELKMDLSLTLVRTLMRRRIEVHETYSDYRLRLNPEPAE
ncbi:MAG: hypothetical protein ABIK54_03010 [candidate division WOR-3 bacterium]